MSASKEEEATNLGLYFEDSTNTFADGMDVRCGVKRKLKDDSKGLAWQRQGAIANDGMG